MIIVNHCLIFIIKCILLVIINYLYSVNAQRDCSTAPTALLKKICRKLHQIDKNTRNMPLFEDNSPGPSADGQPGAYGYSLDVFSCMDLACLCEYLGGNGTTRTNHCTLPYIRKGIRKEYRMLSNDERARFHFALKEIKRNGEYDEISKMHSDFADKGGAHSGPAFLPWHREFLKRFEISLKKVDPSVSLPYWDSTLDGVLPTPKDSVIFSNEFMGTTDNAGNLIRGDFAGWRTLSGRANILRRVGAEGNCFRERDIQWLMQQNKIDLVLGYPSPGDGCTAARSFDTLEYTHHFVHTFVGGDMDEMNASANDPIFFLHHCFVDLIWELWRINNQNRNERETSYPEDRLQCSARQHFSYSTMDPFEQILNKRGLSNEYTDNLYEYAPRPSCSLGPNCGSKWLFCDMSHQTPRCASKIRIGGNCNGYFHGEDVCAFGECQDGICVQTEQIATTQRPIIAHTTPRKSDCYNNHECCSIWSDKGECEKNPKYMKSWCKASCRQCVTDYSLDIDCSDRHSKCLHWAGQGECQLNKFWMHENCRDACGRCNVARSQICSVGKGSNSKQKTQQATCKSKGCFNENICCQVWALNGECTKNKDWMSCNCRVACEICNPNGYDYGTCNDYHNQCRQWAAQGECRKDDWMLENCKTSCNSCINFFQLRQQCGGSRSGRRKRDDVSSLGFQPSTYMK